MQTILISAVSAIRLVLNLIFQSVSFAIFNVSTKGYKKNKLRQTDIPIFVPMTAFFNYFRYLSQGPSKSMSNSFYSCKVW